MEPADCQNENTHPRSWRSRVLIQAALSLTYLAGVVVLTWPLATRLTTHLPQGTEPVATVPLFNAWTVWWNCSRLAAGFASYWTAPIFAPTEGTFTFSELQPTTLVVAPVWYANRNPALAYNVYLWLSLWLNAVFGYWFCRRAGTSTAAAFAGGGLVLCLPFVHWQLGVLQLVPLWPVLWLWGELTVFAFHDRTPSRWKLGLAFAAVYLTCHHYGLFLSLLLPVCSIALIPLSRFRQKRFWMALVANGLLAGILLAPFVIAQLHYLHENVDAERDLGLVIRLSADWGDYTATRSGSWFDTRHMARPERAVYWPLSPGYLVWGMAAAGFLGGLFERGRRRIVLFLSLIVVVGMILSLGPRFHPFGFDFYERVILKWPGFAQIRNIFRYAVFVQLAAALLAANGLNLLFRCGQALGIRRLWLSISVVAAAAVVMAETWPPSPAMSAVPDLHHHARWLHWLKRKTGRDAIVASIPLSRGGGAGAYVITTRSMYLGTVHERRLVNGYSGFFPQSYLDLRDQSVKFPDPQAIAALRDRGVQYVIDLRRSELIPKDLEVGSDLPGNDAKLVYFDSQTQVAIYKLPAVDEEVGD